MSSVADVLARVLITIREGLEAFLIIGTLVGYLTKVNQRQYFKHMWVGSGGALLLSGLAAYLLQLFKISFEGEEAEIFEIFVALIAILAFITVIWEGIETALFLIAVNGDGILLGS
jgi:high-affinity iron transporter